MRILYIFPHPDDESFGAAHVMAKQRREGYEVFLLTLTRGGATKQRFKYNLSVEEMGNIRYKEMLNVAKVLDLTGMKVLDLPDSSLKELDPRIIEKEIESEIKLIKPNVVVTYAVHGISGFHDHLVCHAVVKRVFCVLKSELSDLKRLAFLTITSETAKKQKEYHLNSSKDSEIGCIEEVCDEDIQKAMKSLDCYATFQETINKTGIKELIDHKVYLELFQEKYEFKLKNLFENINHKEV